MTPRNSRLTLFHSLSPSLTMKTRVLALTLSAPLLAAAATDHARVLELNHELRAIVDEREGLELEWLAAAEIVE